MFFTSFTLLSNVDCFGYYSQIKVCCPTSVVSLVVGFALLCVLLCALSLLPANVPCAFSPLPSTPFLSFVPAACCVLPLPVLCLCCFPVFPLLVVAGCPCSLPPSLPPLVCVCAGETPKSRSVGADVFLLPELFTFTVRNRQDIVTFLKRLMQCHSVEHVMQWC